MAELVDALDSKSCGSNTVRVQVPLRPPLIEKAFRPLFLSIPTRFLIKNPVLPESS